MVGISLLQSMDTFLLTVDKYTTTITIITTTTTTTITTTTTTTTTTHTKKTVFWTPKNNLWTVVSYYHPKPPPPPYHFKFPSVKLSLQSLWCSNLKCACVVVITCFKEKRHFLMVSESRKFNLEMSEKSTWEPSTIPLPHSQEKPRPFKLRTVLILVVSFPQIRMRIETVWSIVKNLNSLFTSSLVVCFEQIRMRIETVRAVQTTSSILITHLSLWFVFNKYTYVL